MMETASATSRCIQAADQKSDKGQRQILAGNAGAECGFYSFCGQTIASVCIETSQVACTQNWQASMIELSFCMYSITDSVGTNSVVTGSTNRDTQIAFQTSELGVHPDELPALGNKRAPGGTSRMGQVSTM